MKSKKESTKNPMDKPRPGKPPAEYTRDGRDARQTDAASQQHGAQKSSTPAVPGEDEYQKAPRDYKSSKQVGNKV